MARWRPEARQEQTTAKTVGENKAESTRFNIGDLKTGLLIRFLP